MNYNFDAAQDRRVSESAKWHAYDPDVLPLFVADMDFPSPQPVIEALHKRVDHSIFGYPEYSSRQSKLLQSLHNTIVERMERLYGWSIQPADIVLVPGVVPALNAACQVFAHAGGGILVQPPVYPPFLNLAANANAQHQEAILNCKPDGTYEVDWDVFESAFTPQTRVFVLCNPHNPVGRVYQREELERMVQICLKRDVFIISDEIHCDLLYPGYQHIPIASLDAEIAQRVITLMAPSKTFNLAGLNTSFAIIQDRDLRKRFVNVQHSRVGGVNLLGMVAAEAAYTAGQEWLDQLLVYLLGNRNYVVETIRRQLNNLKVAAPEATYLAWIDCRDAGLPQDAYTFFLEKARVALNDGRTFGTGGEGFVRLNFGCPRPVLAEALERMKTALKAL
jgi:cystathionine beta-lyase